MGNELFDYIVSRLAVIIPMFAKAIVEEGLEKMGADSWTVTPIQMKKTLDEYVLPELRKFVHHYKQVDILGGGIIQTDKNDRLVKVSPMIVQYFETKINKAGDGFSLFENLHKSGLIVRIEEFLKTEKDLLTRKIKIEKPIKFVLDVSMSLLKDSQSNVSGILSLIRDITLNEALLEETSSLYEKLKKEIEIRKEIEKALINSNERFRAIFEGSGDAIILLSEDILLDCNSRTLEMFGVESKEKIVKKSYIDLSPTNQPDGQNSYQAFIKHIKLAFEQGTNRFEWFLKKDNGEVFPAEIFLSAFNYNEERVLQGTIRDITERRQMIQKLLQSQKLESVGRLASGVAHEINTPIQFVWDNVTFLKDSFMILIQSINAYMEMKTKCKESSELSDGIKKKVEESVNEEDLAYLLEEVPKAIEQSSEGLKRISDIVKAMKAFSHPDSDEKVSVNINAVIENAATVSRNEWKYTADLKMTLSDNMPLVLCYQGSLNQVILNIIVNAAHAIEEKYKKEHKGIIAITTEFDEKWAKISISDDGTGIPDKNRSKIFEPFFTTKDVGKGTGQGLFLAYNVIVRQHGGRIEVETAEGKGTIFLIFLPLGDVN